jgi:hypothetical protein
MVTGFAMTDPFENGDSYETPVRTHQGRVGRGRCQVCVHPERIRIEALHVGGVTLDALQAEFGIQRDCIHRHCKNHVSKIAKVNYLAGPIQMATLAQAAARENKSILEYLSVIRSILMNQLVKCAEGGKSAHGGAGFRIFDDGLAHDGQDHRRNFGAGLGELHD